MSSSSHQTIPNVKNAQTRKSKAICAFGMKLGCKLSMDFASTNLKSHDLN
jgi:hypothetical protein